MSNDQDLDDKLINGTKVTVDIILSFVPEVGGFATIVFDLLWENAFAARTAAENRAAMDSLYKGVQKMIDASIDEIVLSQGRELNASMIEFGQDYHISVQSFKKGETHNTATIKLRFETCKTNLVHMLNLFSQRRYGSLLVLSYGSALSMYVQLLYEMVLNGKDTGYTPSEIANFQKDINNKITVGLAAIGEAMRMLAASCLESGHLNEVEWIGDSLQKLVAGLLSFNKNWYPKPVLLATEDYDYLPYTDAVDNNACYLLRTQKSIGASIGCPVLQIYMPGDHFVHHIYENPTTPLRFARFASKSSMTAKLRAMFLSDPTEGSDVVVSVSKLEGGSSSTVASFNFNSPSTTIGSFPWVRLYRPGANGYPFSGNPDLVKVNVSMQFVEFGQALSLESGIIHEIHTKADSTTTNQYYIIGFQLIPLPE